jgi:hypothetical protein
MAKQNNSTPTKRMRITKKHFFNTEANVKRVASAIRTEYSAEKIAIECKRAAEKASKGAKSSKKSRSEESQQASEPASETTSQPVENYEDLLDEETSKHYKEQRKLNEDWDNMKAKLTQRYRMSFAKGNVPDPHKTEVDPLPSCTNCAYQSETTVCVYFLSSKINAIITSIRKLIIVFNRTL